MKLVSVFFTALITLITSADAASAGSSGVHAIAYFKIDKSRLVVYANGTTFTDSAACKDSTPTSEAVAIPTGHENFKELYAAVMLAHANNRNIQFWLDGGCSAADAGGPYPTASMVYVY